MHRYRKLIQAGNQVEIWEYERPYVSRPRKRSPRGTKRIPRRRRSANVLALKKRFVRLVCANLTRESVPAMVTLTYKEVPTVAEHYRYLARFFSRFRKGREKTAKYIGVIEYGSKGRMHAHILLWGLTPEEISRERDTRALARLWGRGFLDVIPTDGSPKLSTYLGKYFTKLGHDDRLIGRRLYTASRNVARPAETSSSLAFSYLEEIIGVDNSPLHTTSYDTIHLGRCIYSQFIVDKNS